MAGLRIRKDTTQLPALYWRVELTKDPPGMGYSIGLTTQAKAMQAATNIIRNLK